MGGQGFGVGGGEEDETGAWTDILTFWHFGILSHQYVSVTNIQHWWWVSWDALHTWVRTHYLPAHHFAGMPVFSLLPGDMLLLLLPSMVRKRQTDWWLDGGQGQAGDRTCTHLPALLYLFSTFSLSPALYPVPSLLSAFLCSHLVMCLPMWGW